MMSRMIRSKCSARARANPPSPSYATSTSKPSGARPRCTPVATLTSSSTTSTRTVTGSHAALATRQGCDAQQYDELVQKMGYWPGGPGAPGGLFHWVTKTDDGLRVTDVWESRDAFEKFAQEKIAPVETE